MSRNLWIERPDSFTRASAEGLYPNKNQGISWARCLQRGLELILKLRFLWMLV